MCSPAGCLYATGDWKADPPSVQDAACKQGQWRACTSLGVRYSLGEGLTRDDDRALALMDQACTQKDTLACVNSIKLHQTGSYDRWVKLCAAGIGEGCLEAGNDIRFGAAAATRTPADGAAFYKKACDMGIGNACARYAFHAATGLAMPRDDDKMYAFFDKACRCEDDTGCSGVAYALREGRGVKKDFTRAADIFGQLCNRRIEASCVHLARMYELGEGVALNLQLALSMYEAACNDAHRDPEGAGGCYMLGQAYRDARGVARDDARALSLFDKGCKEQEALSCGELGRWYRDGRVVPKGTSRAMQLFDFACSHGDDTGCHDADALRASP